jgi:hypothetical protein
MIVRLLPLDPTLGDRFLWLLHQLWDAMGYEWRRRGIPQPVQAALSFRMRGLWKRVRSVLAQWRAGTLKPARERKALAESTPHPNPADQVRGQACPQGRREMEGDGPLVNLSPFKEPGSDWAKLLPRRAGWLRKLMPDSAPYMQAFVWLFDEAELKAFIAEAPEHAGRVLRPFYAFMGVPLPAELRLPERVRVRNRYPSPRPSPSRGEGEEMIAPNRRLPPREQAEDAIRRSEASGKPIDLRKFKPEAYGWYVHPPRDGNCPPPKIGYGGRLRPFPKDYRPPKDWD